MTRDQALAELTAPGGPFAIVDEEVQGQVLPVFRDRLPHLRALCEVARRRGDERTFLVSGERRFGFESFVATANGLGAALRERFGIERGDRVAVLAQNSAEWCLTVFATVNAGAILVGLNGWWKADEILYGLRDCGARLLVADRRRLDRVAHLLDRCPELEGVVVTDADPGEFPLPASLRRARAADLLAEPAAEPPDVPIDEDDPAIILYTSGTTGRPKGAISTHRNIIAGLQVASLNAKANAMAAGRAKGGPSRRSLVVSLFTSPLFHVSGCHGTLISGLLNGMTLVLIEGRITAEKCLAAMERERVTLWATVPTLVWRVCESGLAGRYDLSSVRRVIFGGSPAGNQLQRLVQETFPNVTSGAGTNNYGLTETSGVIASLPAEEAERKPGTVGRPLPTVSVRIAEDGEVLVRGAMVTPGYWGNPQATAEAIRDGWFHTGDIGRLDEDGYLTITDRKKDVIIRGGENIYCVEIEQRLLEHPEILDAAVIGVPHPELGEEVKAIVQVGPGHGLDEAAVQEWVRETLADFKVPAYVELTQDALPRNATGKLLKAELRAAYGAAPAAR